MNSLWQLPAIVTALLAWLSAPPAGLADIAQREAFRRSVTQKSTATLSNLGLPGEVVPPSAVSMPPAETVPPPDDPEVKAAEAAPPKAEAPRDEKWWRDKMNELRSALDKDQFAAEALQTRINVLQADAVNLDDPIKQTKARMDLVRSLDELEKLKKQIASDNGAIAALQDEARRQNIPAGWIR
jgi:hypothetical protein